jgi:hypothetical protein
MSNCVIAIDHTTHQELLGLIEKSERLAEFIRAGLAIAPHKQEHVEYPYICLDSGVGFMVIDAETAIAVIAPRTLEILFGRPLAKEPLNPKQERETLREKAESLFEMTAPIDHHTFAVEFEGAIFNVEVTCHCEDDFCTTLDVFFDGQGGYGVPYEIELLQLIERGASDWLYDILSPEPLWKWTPYSMTPAWYARPDVGMRF